MHGSTNLYIVAILRAEFNTIELTEVDEHLYKSMYEYPSER